MIDQAILITDAGQVHLCADFRANGQKILLLCVLFFFALVLHSAVCLSVAFFYPSSPADGVYRVRWLGLGHTVEHLRHCPLSLHHLVLREGE